MKLKFTDAKGRLWEYDNVVKIYTNVQKSEIERSCTIFPVMFNFAYFDDLGVYHEEVGDVPTGDITIHVDEDEVLD